MTRHVAAVLTPYVAILAAASGCTHGPPAHAVAPTEGVSWLALGKSHCVMMTGATREADALGDGVRERENDPLRERETVEK